VTAAVFVVLLIALGAVAAITAIRSDPPEPPEPRHRLDGDLIQERWDRRRTDRWT
jgi:hypothetical protein